MRGFVSDRGRERGTAPGRKNTKGLRSDAGRVEAPGEHPGGPGEAGRPLPDHGGLLGRRFARPCHLGPAPRISTAMPDPIFLAGPIDLDALDAFLLSDRAPEDSMGLSDLDGFLAGVVVGPELVMPSEWLPRVWGGEEPAFESIDEARSILGTIIGPLQGNHPCPRHRARGLRSGVLGGAGRSGDRHRLGGRVPRRREAAAEGVGAAGPAPRSERPVRAADPARRRRSQAPALRRPPAAAGRDRERCTPPGRTSSRTAWSASTASGASAARGPRAGATAEGARPGACHGGGGDDLAGCQDRKDDGQPWFRYGGAVQPRSRITSLLSTASRPAASDHVMW